LKGIFRFEFDLCGEHGDLRVEIGWAEKNLSVEGDGGAVESRCFPSSFPFINVTANPGPGEGGAKLGTSAAGCPFFRSNF